MTRRTLTLVLCMMLLAAGCDAGSGPAHFAPRWHGAPPFPFEYEHPSDAYYAAYRALPRDMPILWTGRHVVPSELTGEQVRAMRAFVDRPLLLWDNLPVNDVVLAGDVFLGPWQRPGADLARESDGVLLNLMTSPRGSLVMVGRAHGGVVDRSQRHHRGGTAGRAERGHCAGR